MKKNCLIFVLLFSSILKVTAQQKNLSHSVEVLGGFTTSGSVPFWLRSNQYGSIPLDNASLSLIGLIRKNYDITKTRIFDWGASVEGRVNVGHKSNFTLICL